MHDFIFIDTGRTLGFPAAAWDYVPPGRIGRGRADRQRGWWRLHWHHIWLPAVRRRHIAEQWER